VLSRVNIKTTDKALDARKMEVEEFINNISGKSNKRFNPEKIQPIKGLLDEIN
jgi:hypothetical protein